ncbi:hypothetical protein EVAR_87493_1 [Eumeta japonica]|uniref:Uncharacterized protein n=1 Tax=Eumeta variegata TaxID=151549 RepID=A0A4C1VWF0_EUMVA|nr:hypothetical protein EVAR_87493_1 [Eumeta japonica]
MKPGYEPWAHTCTCARSRVQKKTTPMHRNAKLHGYASLIKMYATHMCNGCTIYKMQLECCIRHHIISSEGHGIFFQTHPTTSPLRAITRRRHPMPIGHDRRSPQSSNLLGLRTTANQQVASGVFGP